MMRIEVLLPQLIAEHRLSRKQLADAAGMRYATLVDLYNGKHRPSLQTLELVINGLEKITSKPVEISDLLSIVPEVKELQPLQGSLKEFRPRTNSPRPKVSSLSEDLVAGDRGQKI